ncbi:hypothetical protein V6N13_139390 [Hibiscus sabdariffa]|uniref:Multiple C2 domain-containing protein n=1 Tax=Hibiscus sabdariffa TaxID=183260 RepID=A0ABR2C8Y3_9ROSI
MDTRLSHADAAYPDELDEEFDTFPTSQPSDIVWMRYDRLRSIAGRVETVIGDLATQGERFQSLISWRDPRASTLFVTFCLILALVLYVTPFQVIALLTGLGSLCHTIPSYCSSHGALRPTASEVPPQASIYTS